MARHIEPMWAGSPQHVAKKLSQELMSYTACSQYHEKHATCTVVAKPSSKKNIQAMASKLHNTSQSIFDSGKLRWSLYVSTVIQVFLDLNSSNNFYMLIHTVLKSRLKDIARETFRALMIVLTGATQCGDEVGQIRLLRKVMNVSKRRSIRSAAVSCN